MLCADMAEVEKMVRSIESNGLLWGAGEQCCHGYQVALYISAQVDVYYTLFFPSIIPLLLPSLHHSPPSLSPAKLVPIAFGIKKLQISCVVEDEKVSKSPLLKQEPISAAKWGLAALMGSCLKPL